MSEADWNRPQDRRVWSPASRRLRSIGYTSSILGSEGDQRHFQAYDARDRSRDSRGIWNDFGRDFESEHSSDDGLHQYRSSSLSSRYHHLAYGMTKLASTTDFGAWLSARSRHIRAILVRLIFLLACFAPAITATPGKGTIHGGLYAVVYGREKWSSDAATHADPGTRRSCSYRGPCTIK